MLMKEKDFDKKADYLFDGAVSLKELNLRFGPEIRVSQYGFQHSLYSKSIDYAVHLAVSTMVLNNSLDYKNELSTSVIRAESIANALALDLSVKKSRTINNIQESIDRLVSFGLFDIEYIDEMDKGLFILKQSIFSLNNNGVGNYFYLSTSEYLKLIKIKKNNDKYNAVAIAMSIFSEINYIRSDRYWNADKDYGKVFSERNLDNANIFRRSFTNIGVNILAEKANMSLSTFKRNRDNLIKNKIIKVVKVQRMFENYDNYGSWTNYYCHYEEMTFLKIYLLNLIKSNTKNPKEQIIDVDITEAEKEMRK